MAQYVKAGITIDGKNINQFYSFSLTQQIFDHHTFRLICPAESIDGTSGSVLHASKNFIGGTITMKIETVQKSEALQFTGVITQVEISRHNGHNGDIIISGYSPTVLLDNGSHCQTWEKKPVKGIAEDVLQHFPQNLLKPKISPAYSETLSYAVQYRETAWQFLCRLAATYGEWFFYDGQKLVLGKPQGQKSELVFGKNLHDFSMALQIRPATFEVMAYDYINHQVYNGQPAGISSKAGLNDFGKHVLQKSEKFYNSKPKEWHNNFLTNKQQLDDYVTVRSSMQGSNMVRFHGSGEYPGIQVGGSVSINGKNVYSESEESFGDYHIISVQHHCDGEGNYSNQFTAVPASVKMPPVNGYLEPRCETQSAMVTDNHDPKGLGRVKVKFHWMADSERSPWLRITSPHGGDGKGMFFIPEVGEEVIVGFEGDSPTKPYIIGTVFHGKAKTSFSNAGNDVKAIQTRSGNKVIMNDKEGSVLVEDKDGNNIKIDGSGNISVTSKNSIVLACGDSKIEMKKDGTINLTGKNITTNASQKAKMVSGQAAFTADGQGSEAKMEGMKANMNGSVEAKVAGGAKTDITASGNVAVKGALIMLN